MGTTTVAFVDDHPVLLSGVCQLFAGSGEFKVVAVGKSAVDVVDIAANSKPDVLVLDLNMPGRVLEAIAAVAGQGNRTKLLAFTASTCIDTAMATLDAGVQGYVLKGSSIEELTEAIRQVQAGETYVTPSLAAKLMDRLRKASRPKSAADVSFSRREEEVLRFLLRGCTNKEIADALSISDKTVKHYMTVLIQKLQVRNRVEVVLAVKELANAGVISGAARLN
ncbi:response regulator transcription factor [Paracoccus sp. TK19116]|uniref:Response regulator transcription factor n=2 Tax=Paracoccus albicereus TaxID=2922394 RepID=A0ABT1MRE1_9RHOB|nr:response regulator transcription factor [Paracoccus albicereus]